MKQKLKTGGSFIKGIMGWKTQTPDKVKQCLTGKFSHSTGDGVMLGDRGGPQYRKHN